MDPVTKTYVILLTNRVHPDGKGDATPVRARVATIVASALRQLPDESVLRGAALDGHRLRRRRQRAAPRRRGRRPHAERHRRAAGRRLQAAEGQEGRPRHEPHRPRADRRGDDRSARGGARTSRWWRSSAPSTASAASSTRTSTSSKDEKTGLPIYSLYGATTRPTAEMLQGIDTLVVDLQDIGARFYTYTTTMGYVMEEAAKRKIAVVVLDRPNPINGAPIEGPTVDQSELSFTAYYPMPIRHGMTLGELALLFNAEKKIGADLTVVEMKNWDRDDWFDADRADVGQPVAEHAEHGGGEPLHGHRRHRGVERVGRARHRLAVRAARRAVDRRPAAGGRTEPAEPAGRAVLSRSSFTPTSSRFANELCHGVFIIVTDRDRMRPVQGRAGGGVGALPAVPGGVRGRQGRPAVRRRHRPAHPRRGGPGGHRHGLGRAESAWRLLRAKSCGTGDPAAAALSAETAVLRGTVRQRSLAPGTYLRMKDS